MNAVIELESQSDLDESLNTNELTISSVSISVISRYCNIICIFIFGIKVFSANDSRRALQTPRSTRERNREFIVKFPPRVCSSNEHN